MPAAPYLIGQGTSSSSATTTITPGTPNAAGDTIVVAASVSSSGTISNVTDAGGNSYTQKASNASQNPTYEWVAPGLTGGPGSGPTAVSGAITIHWTSPAGTQIAAAVGCAGLLLLDQNPATTSAGSGTAATITSGTLAGASEACVAVNVHGNSGGAGGSWTAGWTTLMAPALAGTGGQYMTIASQVVAGTSPVTATFNQGASGKWCMALLTFEYQITITPASLPGGTTGTPYTQTLTAAGGTGAGYNWTLASGSLPTGLGLSAGGVISGTPAAAGIYSFTAAVTDSASNTATLPLSITITSGPVAMWSATAARSTSAATVPPPYAQPLAVPVANQGNGNWLLAVATWRQDAGLTGALAEPTTLSIADDAHNMWLPVQVSGAGNGIVRQAVWMAPAARKAGWVFASPTGYQQAAALLVMEFPAAVPWYQAAVSAQAYTNQGTSVSASYTPPAGVFAMGVISWDDLQSTTTTATGWTLAQTITASDGTDHLGDLSQSTYYATSPGTALPLSATTAGAAMDWSVLLVSIHGVADTITLPWSWPNPAWPVVLTEMGFGSPASASPDEITWTDISGRNNSFGPLAIEHAIQYEDQTLTAGTASVALDNPDGALTPPANPPPSLWSYAVSGTPAAANYFTVSAGQAAAITTGNVFIATAGGVSLGLFTVTSVGAPFGGFVNVTFSPAAGQVLSSASGAGVTQVYMDADIPFRVRTVWPWSPTPYSVLFSGYTDQAEPQWDPELLRGWVELTASDVWARLTAQLLTAVQQENLIDGPYAYWTLGDAATTNTRTITNSGSQIAPTGVQAISQITSKYGVSGAINWGFGAAIITLPGDPGGTGWFMDALVAGDGLEGVSLGHFPKDPAQLPPLAAGVTVEFWAFASPAGSGPTWTGITWNMVLAACVGAKGLVWTLAAGAPGGAHPGELQFTVYDKITGAATVSNLTGPVWNTTSLYTIAFTQTTWTVRVNGATLGSGTANFAPVYNGFSFCGVNAPWQGLSGNCINCAIQGILIYPAVLPQGRSIAHYYVASTALAGTDTDTARVARVAGYGGFIPVLASRGLDPQPVSDIVTPVTDTSGQVTSAYITNVASSALAGLFADSTGALVYRRREEWYDRPAAWTLGENAAAPANINPGFTAGLGVYSWTAANAALGWSPAAGLAGGAAVLTATGAGPVTLTPEYQPAVPGEQCASVICVRCPAGLSSGAYAQLVWANSGGTPIGTTTGAAVSLIAGAWTFLQVSGRAPAGAAQARAILVTVATPPANLVIDVDTVLTTISPYVLYGEVPYEGDVKLSLDRAQMYNAAIISQYGDQVVKTTNTGTQLTFTSTSGITVYEAAAASIGARGAVPYTATAYLNNTAAAQDAYAPGQGSLEDYGQWIVNTLGAPRLRGEQITITPAATGAQAMAMALQADVGDTVTFTKRPGYGQPVTLILAYLSGVTHHVDFAGGGPQAWTTSYVPSPAPQAQVLQCDNVTCGVLDGTNPIPW